MALKLNSCLKRPHESKRDLRIGIQHKLVVAFYHVHKSWKFYQKCKINNFSTFKPVSIKEFVRSKKMCKYWKNGDWEMYAKYMEVFWKLFYYYTGDSCYVDFAYLDTITYVEMIFHSQHISLYIFAFQLRLCRKRLTWSNGYLEVIFHALDLFSITFATACVKVKNRPSQGRPLVCFGFAYALPEVQKSSKQWSKTSFDWAINPLFSAVKSIHCFDMKSHSIPIKRNDIDNQLFTFNWPAVITLIVNTIRCVQIKPMGT